MKSVIQAYSQGTIRSCSPEQTLTNIAPHLKKMGITRLANITGLDYIDIPVYVAVRPNARYLSLSQGKGINEACAKVSALMEAIESYHAENIDKPLYYSNWNDLVKNKKHAASLDLLPQYLTHQFSAYDTLLWISGENINNGKNIYVPYETVHVDGRLPLPAGQGKYISGTNGLASGNTREEAILHSIYELIERDSYALWSLGGQERQTHTKIRLTSIDDLVCNLLIEKYKKSKICIGIWNITSDLGIPCFLVRIISPEMPPCVSVRPAMGMGCHSDKNIALSRALTEAAQSRLTFISGARDDICPSHYRTHVSEKEFLKWHRSICLFDEISNFQKIETHLHISLSNTLEELKKNLKNHNLKQIIVCDLTKEEFNIPVVRTIIPGLEGPENYEVMKQGKRALEFLDRFKKDNKEKCYG